MAQIKRTRKELTEIAIGATRSQLRSLGINPVTVTSHDAYIALDDMCRSEESYDKSFFFFCETASDTDYNRFCRTWDKWVKDCEQDNIDRMRMIL